MPANRLIRSELPEAEIGVRADIPCRAWGTLAAIDLHGCAPDALADPTCIRAFRCFVDVFSCRVFDAELAAAVAVEHFSGTATLRLLRR
jgi:hypothetical protein